MHFIRLPFSAALCRHRHHIRYFYDAVNSIKCVRDRGLDHAVEREKHLRPVLNLKNLIVSEPSKSIPLSLIVQSKDALQIPFRPIEFIRKYPSVFQEFHPAGLNIHPHIKLTSDTYALDAEEKLLYESVNYKQEVANRLLKLLMISRINVIPISVLERLKWELGLPQDYDKVIIPEFPDYFRIITRNYDNHDKMLELVCWSNELAVSEMEKKGSKEGKIEFALQYPKGFELDRNYKKWLDEWQRIPYVSPYENATHLASKSDESDKWAVAVLHELLNLFVGKKADKESVLFLGECLGLRSRFKRALLQHPGSFYVSSKIGTHTVVLREAYKRGMLIVKHPLSEMRFKYVHLMNVVIEEPKSKSMLQKTGNDLKAEGSSNNENEEEEEEEVHDLSDYGDDDEEEDGEETTSSNREWSSRRASKFEEKNLNRSSRRRLAKRNFSGTANDAWNKYSRRKHNVDDQSVPGRSIERLEVSRSRTRSQRERTSAPA